MCNYTYHHYPSCGHISNWSMTSCQEYTNKLRLAGPERSVSCTVINASHDLLLSTQPSMCVQCESEWAQSLSHSNSQVQSPISYRSIEGLGVTGNIIKMQACMVSDSDPDDRDSSSADHSDNGQLICLGAVVGKSDNGDTSGAGHSDNGQSICLCAVARESDSHCDCVACVEKRTGSFFNFAQMDPHSPEIAARVFDWSVSVSASAAVGLGHISHGDEYEYATGYVETDSPVLEGCACASSRYESSCGSSSCGSLCGSDLLRYNVLKLRVDEYIKQRERARKAIETDFDKQNADTFGIDENTYLVDLDDPHVALKDTRLDSVDNPECNHDLCEQPCIDIDLMQQRIEATVRKRIEEDNEKQARQEAMSKLLDEALLQKDKNDRRQQNAGLGIKEDPRLWDTESIAHVWDGNSTTAIPDDASSITNVSPRTDTLPKSQQALSVLNSQPQMHLYMGNMFALTAADAQQKGLQEIRPYSKYPKEWEGFMRALSTEDANRMHLLDPEHVRGCCEARPASFHLFYGLMHAASEAEAERRWLEDIRRIPGEEGKFYGLLRADNERHARAMGLTEIRHPWGCCKDGLFSMPERVRHVYTGFMSAVSLEAVGEMGLCDAQPVPGECGDYYGGIYSGYVEAFNEFDAFAMGLIEPEHAGDCCGKAVEDCACVSIPEAGQYMYYGYMYARSEEEVMNRGLKDVLLVPGFNIKYSGNLWASSEDEAKAMGLFESSRIEWSGDTRVPEGFVSG
ncbi:hypothetical protein N7475_009096 [Penicillium sp. IBT 31633x]|nr:hypothetical protein N7475_009096 [Penicillium sp. IBT 31633x]